jgi:hypothetical protein
MGFLSSCVAQVSRCATLARKQAHAGHLATHHNDCPSSTWLTHCYVAAPDAVSISPKDERVRIEGFKMQDE